MSIAVVIPLAVLSAIVIGVCGAYVRFKKRKRLHSSHPHEKVLNAPSTVDEFPIPKPESEKQVESGEIQAALGKTTITAVHEDDVHIYIREEACAEIFERVPEKPQGLIPESASPHPLLAQRGWHAGNGGYVRLKTEVIGQDAQIRFSLLKDWISLNMLAILRRASRDWWTAQDLIAIVPSYLQPEAEILKGRVLLIRTRGHAEQLLVPIQYLDPSSDFSQCFDFLSDDQTAANSPAVVLRSDGRLNVISRGTVMQTMAPVETAGHKHQENQDASLIIITITGFGTQEFERGVRKGSRVLASESLVSARR